VHETAAERSNQIANNQVQLLLASVEDASISPSEFLTLIEDTAHASRRKMEDNVFIRLYRGYTAEDMADWVIFPPDNAQVNITCSFESESLENRLVFRDAVCPSYCLDLFILLIQVLSLLF
jgi:hypothetical protein